MFKEETEQVSRSRQYDLVCIVKNEFRCFFEKKPKQISNYVNKILKVTRLLTQKIIKKYFLSCLESVKI